MRSIWGWMVGRRTYLLAGVVILALLVLVFLGRLTPDTGVALLTFAAGVFAVAFRSVLQRHHAEAVAILKGVADAGAAAAAHNGAEVIAIAKTTVPEGVKLVEEIRAEKED